MRMLAIAGCAALLTSCAPHAHAPAQPTALVTPVRPAPSPGAVKTRTVALRLPTLDGRTVTTVVKLPPNLHLGHKGVVLEAKPLWRIAAAPSPAPPDYARPQLSASDTSFFVSTGTDIERIGVRDGRLLWLSREAAAPFAAGSNLLAAAHGNSVTALSENTGALLWRRAVCPSGSRIASLASDGRAIFALCATPDTLIALGAQNGHVLYKRVLSHSDRGMSVKVLGSGALLVDGLFEGAWMGENIYVVREHTGDVALKRTDIKILRVRGSVADFVDQCCFGRSDIYEPAKILPVNLLNGDVGKEAVLAPEPDRFQEDGAGGAYGPDGSVFIGNDCLYLFYGDTLFRYSHLNAAPAELLRGIERLVYTRADGFVAVLEGEPDSVLFSVDWTAQHPVLRPIAAIKSVRPNQAAVSPVPMATDTFDGVRLAVFSHGEIVRLQSTCTPLGTTTAQGAHVIAAICTSASGVGYVEALSDRP